MGGKKKKEEAGIEIPPRKVCNVDTGETFDHLISAAKSVNLLTSELWKAIDSGSQAAGYTFKYVEESD
eukprot:g11627.t1